MPRTVAVAALIVRMPMRRGSAVRPPARWARATLATAIATAIRPMAAKSLSIRSATAAPAATSAARPTPRPRARRARAAKPAVPAMAIAMGLLPTAAKSCSTRSATAARVRRSVPTQTRRPCARVERARWAPARTCTVTATAIRAMVANDRLPPIRAIVELAVTRAPVPTVRRLAPLARAALPALRYGVIVTAILPTAAKRASPPTRPIVAFATTPAPRGKPASMACARRPARPTAAARRNSLAAVSSQGIWELTLSVTKRRALSMVAAVRTSRLRAPCPSTEPR